MEKFYTTKADVYFSGARTDLIALVPPKPENRILEIGSGTGSTLMSLKNRQLAREVVGVELLVLEDSYQQAPEIDNMFIGDIEAMELPYPEDYFDVILCGDVLEHLSDPWSVLKRLYAYLKPGGKVIISLPNIREINAMVKIFFRGDFSYTGSGIFDETHLRFFCKRNMKDLVQSCGLDLVSVHTNLDLRPEAWRRKMLNRLSLGVFEQFLALQYILVAQKKV